MDDEQTKEGVLEALNPEVLAVEALTYDELNSYFLSKEAEKPCGACGYSGEWDIKTDGDQPSLLFVPDYRNPSVGTLFFTLTCPNCMNTRLFDALDVMRILRSAERDNG